MHLCYSTIYFLHNCCSNSKIDGSLILNGIRQKKKKEVFLHKFRVINAKAKKFGFF